MAKLVGTAGLTMGREYPVGELCIIGRSPDAHVRLPDLAVSRQHAKITRVERGYTIEDLESTSGTVVNGLYVTVSRVRHGDEIGVGSFHFRFVDGPPERVSTAEFAVVSSDAPARVVSVDVSRPTAGSTGAEPDAVARLTRRLNAILAVGKAASRGLAPRRLLDELMGYCLEVFPAADRALVAIPDRARQSLVVQSIAKRQGVTTEQFSLSRAEVSEVLYKGRSVIIGPEEGAPRAGRVIVAPLICQGQMLGLIHVDQVTTTAAPFSGEDLDLLTGMAAHIALALHSAQLSQALLRQTQTEQELAAAHEVQKRFLPRGVPKVPGFSFVAHYGPCRDVGGDLYDFIPLDERRLGVVIGDVSGKGFAGAIVMAWVTSQLRVAAHQEREPARVLGRVNESLLEAHQDDLFVTLIYGVLDLREMTFTFCNAGHVPPLVRRRQSGKVEIVEQGVSLPVGVVSDATFEEREVTLARGDALLLVTDGVTEATSPQQSQFGLWGLVAATASSVPVATTLVSDVLAALREFTGGGTPTDDITIVAIGASVEETRTTLPPERAG